MVYDLKEVKGEYNSCKYFLGDIQIGSAWWDDGGYKVKFSLVGLKTNKFDSYEECEEWLSSRIGWMIDYLQDA